MVGLHETGNETYARGLLSGFESIRFPLDVYAFELMPSETHRNHRIWPHASIVRIPLSTPLLRFRDRLTVYHATYVLPPVLGCASVVTVHDITFALHPEWFPPPVQRTLAALVPRAIRQASRVITISEHSKADIVERYHVSPDKVIVTYLAPRPEFTRPLERAEEADPFFLYVGNVQPRKNLATVLQGFALARHHGVGARLIIAGTPGIGFGDIVRLTHDLGLDGVVEFRGYVSDAGLRALYASCTALVHPALYEGFGLTPLEAMTQGVPVLVADTSSIPEVVGNAALRLPVLEPEAWADAMRRVSQDRTLRDDLADRGRARAQRFSWEQCARQTVEVYTAVDAESRSVRNRPYPERS
jgi:glycosyltransferase involved in cell wall biosynthesis